MTEATRRNWNGRKAARPAAAKASPGTRFGAWLARPLASFHLIVAIATLLTVLGLVMVLSASSVEAYADGGSAYSLFIQQAMFAAIGCVLFYLALRKAGVPAEMHVYERGPHGMGLGWSDIALSSWPARLADWLQRR